MAYPTKILSGPAHVAAPHVSRLSASSQQCRQTAWTSACSILYNTQTMYGWSVGVRRSRGFISVNEQRM